MGIDASFETIGEQDGAEFEQLLENPDDCFTFDYLHRHLCRWRDSSRRKNRRTHYNLPSELADGFNEQGMLTFVHALE